MAPHWHSSTLAWKIPWTEEPGRLQSMGSLESDRTERLHFHFSLSHIGEGNGNPLQCSCLENPRDREAWWAAVSGVAQSQTRLKRLSSSSSRQSYSRQDYRQSSFLFNSCIVLHIGLNKSSTDRRHGCFLSFSITGHTALIYIYEPLLSQLKCVLLQIDLLPLEKFHSEYIQCVVYQCQRRQWHPTGTPVLLPGKSYGRRRLVGCSPWGLEESDLTERLHFHFSLSCIGEGNGNPLWCSCLENPRDSGAWWAAVYRVAQSWTRLK